ncbi:ATP-binding protein [Streptomyces sp. NPDC005840]|uniref:ATP-binding protein n=1 Tax=Streptomyces sp. NPDC005840 TaxID=3157072 RepID=UPI0033F526AE
MDAHQRSDLTQTPLLGMPPAGENTSPQTLTVAQARDSVQRLLYAHYDATRTAPAKTEVQDALLVTSELVTNAVRHGGGLAAFSADVEHGELLLRITDNNPAPPGPADDTDIDRPGGFGWALANRLCRALSVRPLPGGDGKTIVAHFPLGTQTDAHEA